MEIHKREFLSSKNFTLKVWKAAGLKIWYTGFEKDMLIELTQSPTEINQKGFIIVGYSLREWELSLTHLTQQAKSSV